MITIIRPVGKNFFQIKKNADIVFTGVLDEYMLYVSPKSLSINIQSVNDLAVRYKFQISDTNYSDMNTAMQDIANIIFLSYSDITITGIDTIVYQSGEYFGLTDSYRFVLIARRNMFDLKTERIFGEKKYNLINKVYSKRIFNSNVSFADLTTQLEVLFGNPDILNGEFPPEGGTTLNRPVAPLDFSIYFDTDLSKPIWYNGTVWKDATGLTV